MHVTAIMSSYNVLLNPFGPSSPTSLFLCAWIGPLIVTLAFHRTTECSGLERGASGDRLVQPTAQAGSPVGRLTAETVKKRLMLTVVRTTCWYFAFS